MHYLARAFLLSRALLTKRLPVLANQHRVQCSSWNYEEEKKNFKLVAPSHYNFARDVVDSWAEKEKVSIHFCTVFYY